MRFLNTTRLIGFSIVATLLASPAFAFSYNADRYEEHLVLTPGSFQEILNVSDDFTAGFGAGWNTINGTVTPGPTSLNFSNPGNPLLGLPPGWAGESSNIGGRAVTVFGGVGTGVVSLWDPTGPLDVGDSMALSLSSFSTPTSVAVVSITLSNRHDQIAADSGSTSGYNISLVESTLDLVTGNVTFLTLQDLSITEADVTSAPNIALALEFDDSTGLVDAGYSLTGGPIANTGLTSVPLNRFAVDGQIFSQIGSTSIVPEPGTALLMGLGLAGLASTRKKEAA